MPSILCTPTLMKDTTLLKNLLWEMCTDSIVYSRSRIHHATVKDVCAFLHGSTVNNKEDERPDSSGDYLTEGYVFPSLIQIEDMDCQINEYRKATNEAALIAYHDWFFHFHRCPFVGRAEVRKWVILGSCCHGYLGLLAVKFSCASCHYYRRYFYRGWFGSNPLGDLCSALRHFVCNCSNYL